MVVQLGAGWEVGGWETLDVGVGWRLDARMLEGFVSAAVDSMRPKMQRRQVGCKLQGELASGSKVSRECCGIDQCCSGRQAVTTFLCVRVCVSLSLSPLSLQAGAGQEQPWASRAGDRE